MVLEDGEPRAAAARIRSSGQRISRMLDELYDLARARLSGGVPLERAEVDLSTTTRAVIDEFCDTVASKRILLTDHGSLTGRWDGNRLCQVVTNLLGNAVRHGTDDTPVSVDLDGRDSGQVVLSVHNHGVIPSEVRPYLFDPFRTTRGPARGQPGLGLGLYIVEQIVRAHGGAVDVDSAEGTGTTFTVRLPR